MTGTNEKGMILQERDLCALAETGGMGVVDNEIVMRAAGFRSKTRVNERLLKLTRAGLLRRTFLGTVGGARKALYSLTPKGAALVNVPVRGPRRRHDEVLTVDPHTTHHLAVNRIYCALKFEKIPVNDAWFVGWCVFVKPLAPGYALIPDGYAVVSTSEKPIPLFLEVDLGTENLAVWKKKIGEYLRYAASGEFATRFHEPQFRVIVVADTERRMQSLRRATAELTDKIFWFASEESIRVSGLWSAIWLRPKGDDHRIFI